MRLLLSQGAIQYKSRSDVELLDLARHGNSTAFDELVTRYQSRVYAMARDLLVREEDVIDAVREAFVSSYRDLMGRSETADNPGACFHRHAVRSVLIRAGRQRIAELGRS